MKLFLCFIFVFVCGNAQDSTFSHFKDVLVIDSILFVGDTARYEIDGDFHIAKRQWYSTDTHNWKERGNERICSGCLRYERFHFEEQEVYTYDAFYLAKQKIFGLMKGKK